MKIIIFFTLFEFLLQQIQDISINKQGQIAIIYNNKLFVYNVSNNSWTQPSISASLLYKRLSVSNNGTIGLIDLDLNAYILKEDYSNLSSLLNITMRDISLLDYYLWAVGPAGISLRCLFYSNISNFIISNANCTYIYVDVGIDLSTYSLGQDYKVRNYNNQTSNCSNVMTNDTIVGDFLISNKGNIYIYNNSTYNISRLVVDSTKNYFIYNITCPYSNMDTKPFNGNILISNLIQCLYQLKMFF